LLFWTAPGGTPEDEDGGFCGTPQRQDRPEVSVGRDNSAIFGDGNLEDLLVGRSLHAEVSHVQGVVPCPHKLLGDDRRERIIYEKPQTEKEVSNERDLPLPDGLCGVTQRLAHVFALQIRVSLEDLLFVHTVGDHPHHRRNWYAQAADGRHPSHLAGIHRYTIECHPVATFTKLFLTRSYRTRSPLRARGPF
jgi:hypothetical protein